ncbi:MAG: hypothetical protein KF906_00565 [Actinobacteria bacterium]|nr:hypothetical protein [Actinomycetota bacterium]
MPSRTDADPDASRRFWWWTVGSALFAALVRFRYVFEPLAPDEGGYLAIARAWRDGGALYTEVWIDRPQGMLVLYRIGDLFTGLGLGWLRILAVVLGTSGIVGVAWMGRQLSGRWQAGAVAAVFAAILSSSPAIEGFTANGELMSAAFVVPGMAITAAVVCERLDRRWLFVAGVFVGLALSVKQSGYDGLIGTGLWLLVAWFTGWRERKDLIAMGLWLTAGLAAFLGLLFWHGSTFGWDAYFDATIGFRLHSRSAVSTPQWGRLAITTGITVGISIGMLALAAWRMHELGRSLRSMLDRRRALAVCWLVGAGLALLTGGNYHRHYWITVVFPLALVLALVVTDRPPAADGAWPLPPRELALACVVPFVVTAVLLAFPGLEQDHRLEQNRAVAAWVDEHGEGTNGILLPICGSADYHVVAGQTPPYRYLWVDNVVAADDAIDQMEALLDDPEGPAFVGRFQPLTDCDDTGRIEAALERNFVQVAVVDGIPVLRRR